MKTFMPRLSRWFCALIIFCTFLQCSKQESQPQISSDAFPFVLNSYKNGTVKLKDYAGKMVLVVFWATWCQPCLMETASLRALDQELPKDKFQVLAISVDDDPAAVIPNFQAQYQLPYPILYGNQDVIRGFGNISGLPSSFLVNPKGQIVYQFVGLTPYHQLKERIDKEMTKFAKASTSSPKG